MIRTLLATLASLPHWGLGSAVTLFALVGMYRFDGGKSASESINVAISGGLNPDQHSQGGRCRVNLSPR
jgi:hypothetical protein